jgi:hypothetical protein
MVAVRLKPDTTGITVRLKAHTTDISSPDSAVVSGFSQTVIRQDV